MTSTANDFLYKVKYLSFFVTRAFLLAILGLLVIIAILLAIYYGDMFINVKTGNYNSPIFNGYVIVSKSMLPTINVNDAIVVKREVDDGYKVGDIISFYSREYDDSGIVVTHRVIDKQTHHRNSSSYVTKGDNNSAPDRWKVDTSRIYGKVYFIIPKLGYVQNFLSEPIHFILCIIIPSGLVILYDLIRIKKAFRKERNFS